MAVDGWRHNIHSCCRGAAQHGQATAHVPAHGHVARSPASSGSSLTDWGVPAPVAAAYARRGVKGLYPWQAQCLATPGVLQGRNLLYCAPTSGGKTLVSEILMLRSVLQHRLSLFVLPYISIVSEKVRHFERVFNPKGARARALECDGFHSRD